MLALLSRLVSTLWSQPPPSPGMSRMAAAMIMLLILFGLVVTYCLLRLVARQEAERKEREASQQEPQATSGQKERED